MRSRKLRWGIAAALLLSASLKLSSVLQADNHSILISRNASGAAATFSTTGTFDFNNPFFKSIGSNGRSCVTCHQPDQAWGISAKDVQRRFKRSQGTDPIFRPVDGANCPTTARQNDPTTYSQLLNRGLIRIDRPIPANAEFTIEVTSDPYTCSSPIDISVYRRPLPTANLKFLSTVMWDGRENVPGQAVFIDFLQQASDATTGHAQGVAPDAATLAAIRQFETSIFTAQVFDNRAGSLSDNGATGGPIPLSQQDFFIGINDPLGFNPTSAAFDSHIFNLFTAWENLTTHGDEGRNEARASIARGEQLFNTFPIPIFGVGGLNGPFDKSQAVIAGTCGTCHDSPNAGDHSVVAPLNIGLTDASRRTPDQPLFTLTNKTTGQVVQTTDPGRAMVSGRWIDIGKFKGPILRGLAARAPYFHNGSAATLLDAVNFYDTRFDLHFTPRQRADLVAFLNTL
jgi:cytochrome c peroxidase